MLRSPFGVAQGEREGRTPGGRTQAANNYETWWFGDVNYSEDHVALHIRKWDGSTYGRLVYGVQYPLGIAPGDGDAWTAVSDTWPRGSNPAGYYRACFAPWNRVVNTYTTYD